MAFLLNKLNIVNSAAENLQRQPHMTSRGFTIVELLIVIVVIGILAAISIVAYNGVTKRANASAAKGNATSVQKVAEAYNADENGGAYPTLAQLTTGTTTVKLPSGVTASATAPTAANGKTTIGYATLGTSPNFTGACIAYWDFNASTPGVAYVYAGAARTGSPTGTTTGSVTCA